MEENAVTILIALIGAIAGLVGGTLSGRQQARLDNQKWKREVSDAFKSDLRNSVKELITRMAAATHSMSWLCWLAKTGPEQLQKSKIEQYDEEMHVLLPQITGLQAVIAGMDFEVYSKLKPSIKDVVSLDARVGAAGLGFVEGNRESASELAKLYQQSFELEEKLSLLASEALRHYAIDVRTSEWN